MGASGVESPSYLPTKVEYSCLLPERQHLGGVCNAHRLENGVSSGPLHKKHLAALRTGLPAAVHRRLFIPGRMPDEVHASVFERLHELNEPGRGHAAGSLRSPIAFTAGREIRTPVLDRACR